MGLLLAGSLATGPFRAATFSVCAVGCDFSSIQAGVDGASAGDTLLLAAEPFSENVTVAKDLTIEGAGPLATIVDGAGAGRVFTIDNAVVTLRGMTLRNGVALSGGGAATVGSAADLRLVDVHVRDNAGGERGAGIFNLDGKVAITRTLISDNSAPGNATSGGGLYSAGTTTVRDSVIRYNDAAQGGGIYSSGQLTVTRTAVHGNVADYGGGISVGGGSAVVEDSTVSSNTADEGGAFCVGLFEAFEQVRISRSTIAGNDATLGGGIFDYAQVGTIELGSTILSGNPGGNCHPATGVFVSGGHNVEDADDCGLSAAGDQASTDPLLGPLAANGGPGPTHALGASSPAIDAGANGCGAVDQRGEARPVDGDADGTIGCDAGAYERTCAGAYRPERGFGRLLFAPRCTADASVLPGAPGQPESYASRQLSFYRGPRDRVWLVASPATEFAALVADDALEVDGQPSGLAPWADQPGTPPYTLGVPIQNNRVPQPAQELGTDLVPLGPSSPTFELVDTDRQIYGNMAIYLVVDCSIAVDGKSPTTLRFLSRDDAVDGVAPVFDVVSGFVADLQATGDFSFASCLADAAVGAVEDFFEDPPPGQARYYVARGVSSCLAQGFGDASPSLDPDPRDDLETFNPCP